MRDRLTKHQRAADLRRIAETANEQDRAWEWLGGYPQRIIRVGDAIVVAECFESPDAPSLFAEFIATFDPLTVLALLDRLDDACVVIERMANGASRPECSPELDRLLGAVRKEQT